MPKRSAEKEAFWRRALADQEESGLSVRQFCQRKKIAEASFYGWRRELALRDREGNGSERQAGSAAGHEQAFVPLRVTPSPVLAAGLELLHPSGHVIRIPAGFDDETLRRILSILES